MHATVMIMLSAACLMAGEGLADAVVPHHLPAATRPVSTLARLVETWASTPVHGTVGTPVTLDGELVCLPRQAERQEALTLECALGLRTLDGKHYALENITSYLIAGTIVMGQQVQVSGRLHAAPQAKYEAVGLLAVTAVHPREAP
jgi:hypothetical protein